MPMPSMRMIDNWRNTGCHTDESWRFQQFETFKIEPLKIEPLKIEPIKIEPIRMEPFSPWRSDRNW